MKVLSLHRANFPSIFPYARQTDRGVKPEVDAKWDRNVTKDGPSGRTIKAGLKNAVLHRLCLECVEDPESKIADEEKHYPLAARLEPDFMTINRHGPHGCEQKDLLHTKNI